MAPTKEDEIKAIEDEIFKTQKNKNTEHHIGKLKAKMARLKEDIEKQKSSGGGKGKGFSVKKSGDATVGIVGFPSVGKSTLLNQITDADSKVGDYDFTTLETIPGMMKYKSAYIQLLDLPGMITGAAQGRGKGREILSAVRSVDLLLLMIDTRQRNQLDIIEKELFTAGLRVNKRPPNVVVRKTNHGGILVNTTLKLTRIDDVLIKTIASEFVINADITIREDLTEDQLIDVFTQNRIYVPALIVLNKTDLFDQTYLNQAVNSLKKQGWMVLAISAKNKKGLDELKEAVYKGLKFIRIYLKPMGKDPDYKEPMILREGAKVETICVRLHRTFKEKFRYAQIWGSSAKHTGQRVGLDHLLKDQDVVTIVLKK